MYMYICCILMGIYCLLELANKPSIYHDHRKINTRAKNTDQTHQTICTQCTVKEQSNQTTLNPPPHVPCATTDEQSI